MSENVWKSRQFLIYFFLLYIANLAAISASNSFFLSSISLDLMNASKLFIGFFVGLPRYMVIILGIIFFKYAEKINRRTIITWGSVIGILSFLGLSYSEGYVTLIFFCVLYGCAYMVALNYIIVMLLDYTPIRQRTLVLGLFTTSSSLGSFFGPYLTHTILNEVLEKLGANPIFPHLTLFGMFSPFSAQQDPNLMFLSGVIYYAVVGIFMLFAFRISDKLPLVEGPVVEPSGTPKVEKKENVFKELWSDYSGVSYLDMLLGAMWTALMTFVPSFDHVLGLGESSWFFLGFSIVALLGRIFLAPQLGRWRVSFVMSGGFFLYVSCFFLMSFFGFFPSWWLLFLTGSVQGLAHGVMYPSMNILFTHRVPHQTARSTLAFVIMFQTGALFNVPLGGLVDALGHEMAFCASALFFGLICLFFLRQRSLQDFFHRVDINMRAD